MTESDVEQKLLFPLLTNAPPDGLGFLNADVRTKSSLTRLRIGKGRTEQLYFPDYVVLLASLPALVVEAKSPKESALEGYREARLYAAEINARYPTGVNPCAGIISCNGVELLAGPMDTADPKISVPLAELHPASVALSELIKMFGRVAAQGRIDSIRASIASHPLYRATALIGGESARNEEIQHNSFGEEIALRFRRLFNPTTLDDRVRVVKEAYITSKRREKYVEPIDRLIRGATPRTISHVKPIEDSSKPRELTDVLSRGTELEKQIVLLVGSVGSGKSTFVDYLQHVALSAELRAATLWVRVDLNRGPLNKELAYQWLSGLILDQLRLSNPDEDFDELESLERVFGPELRTFKKGPLKLLDESSADYRVRLADELTRLVRDQLKFAQCLARYLCSPTSKLLVIVLDNCDKRTRDEQLLMFEIANWVQEQFRCLTLLPIRDVTYDAHRNEPPLDTALKDLVLRIEPPLFHRVLQGRVRLALKELDVGKGRRQFDLPNGIRVDYPASDMGMYLACILRSLFEYDTFLRRILSSLAGRDVRKALELFLDFCSSGHIGADEILKIRAHEGEHVLPFHVVANVLLRMDRRFYDGTRSHLLNVFQCSPEDPLPDHFVRFEVLSWLWRRVRERGPSGQMGYFRTSELVSAMSQGGHDADRVRKELRVLLQRGCIVAEHQRLDSLADDDLVAVSASGSVHLELARGELYLAACAEDTWLSDRDRASRIAGRIGVSKAQHLRATVFRQNARELAEYLISESGRRLVPSEGFVEQLDEAPSELARMLDGLRESATAPRATNRRVCLRNVAYNASVQALTEEIQRLLSSGQVTDCYLVERAGKRTGTAFLEFSSAATADQALDVLDGAFILGRMVAADVAFERLVPTKSRARQEAGR
ncbi:MAG: RNA-binding protein [Polyangiaceae bacterium]